MRSVAEAQAIILKLATPLPPETAPLATQSLGCVLAEDVTSDIDVPPYDKSLMDGFAVRSADAVDGVAELEIIETVHAGAIPHKEVRQGQATNVMTGAMLPPGADAVVMKERASVENGNRVRIDDPGLAPEKNVLRQGKEMRRGEIVLRAGTALRPPELGLLATVGRTAIKLIAVPRVAVLSTGDELVEPMEQPGTGQIRNGNGPMLCAQTVRAGGLPRYLGIGRDRIEHLRSLIKEGLESSILVLSGGVSAGQRDLVPQVLEELGVEAQFHKVELKPGKPVFFGTAIRDTGASTLVFGLPGNPVSSLVCFELFVRPAIRRLLGHADALPELRPARLAEDFPYRADRPTYHPAQLTQDAEGCQVRMVPWLGSPDLRALTHANALALLPVGDHRHKTGDVLTVMPFG